MPPNTCALAASTDVAVAMAFSPARLAINVHSQRTWQGGRCRHFPTAFFSGACRSASLPTPGLNRRARQPIELLSNMRRLGRCIGERNGPVESDAGLLAATEFEQKGAPRPVEIEIAIELCRQRLEHCQRRLRPAHLGG